MTTIAHLPEPGNLPPLTAEQLAGIMHAGVGTLGDVAYVPDECSTCSRARYWHTYLNPQAEQETPRHLDLNAPALATCSVCGRSTWSPSEAGKVDGMTNPHGGTCGGTFVEAS